MLKNKNILLGITGSISVYKSLELIRLYIKAGANVKVIMSQASQKFVSALSFETISQAKILDDTNEDWDKDSFYNHIAIGKWADIFILCPLSANTINKLSNGIADNILSQTVLAYNKKILLCPAANTNMLENSITRESLKKLKNNGMRIVEPLVKELACRDVGKGALANISDIYYESIKILKEDEYWKNRKVVISGGGTIEKIDDVRYISNFSSGKMAASLALALYLKGANVVLVTTRGHEDLPLGLKIKEVTSSKEMHENLEKELNIDENFKKPYLFMVAAVSDYLPSLEISGKLKKEDLGNEWNLLLNQNLDILNSLNKEKVYSIGFKAETNKKSAKKNALAMLENKNLDAVCLNIINENNPFGGNTNEIELLLKNESYSFKGSKLDISFDLLISLQKLFNDKS
ncbi:MAG: bifunctional phosphopantothenoylcysteine decarboxylase/phosphopantothenate--cysteine ligase CoaBC [Arcobacter sp.]|nr:MAG: bifunctional phosphopantothenoylcysteine decarboxylase/phosphopantothenate--cysteine ligase CoaBC [Arcobacter sp.]